MALDSGSRLLHDVSAALENRFVRIVQENSAQLRQPPLPASQCQRAQRDLLADCGVDASFVVAIKQNGANRALRELQRAGIDNVAVWPGVVGKRLFERDTPSHQLDNMLTPTTRIELRSGTHANNFVPHNSGAIGFYLSHAALWYFIVQNSLTAALIFEEDVRCPKICSRRQWQLSCAETIARYVQLAGGPTAFDVLHLSAQSTMGHGGSEQTEPWHGDLVRTRGPCYTTMAYVITQRGARALLRNLLPISITVDSFLFERARENDQFLVLRPKRRLFEHPITNFLTSTIGYKPSLHLIAPQYRTLAVGAVVGLLLIVIVCLIVRLHVLKRQQRPDEANLRKEIIAQGSAHGTRADRQQTAS